MATFVEDESVESFSSINSNNAGCVSSKAAASTNSDASKDASSNCIAIIKEQEIRKRR